MKSPSSYWIVPADHVPVPVIAKSAKRPSDPASLKTKSVVCADDSNVTAAFAIEVVPPMS